MKRVAMILVIALCAGSSGAAGQSIQAFRGLATSPDSIRVIVRSLAGSLTRRLAAVDDEASRHANATEASRMQSLGTEREMVREALAATNDPRHFLELYEHLLAFEDQAQSYRSSNERSAAMLPPPPVVFKIPDVTFVIGISSSFGPRSTIEAGASTNLLGDAIGTAFDAIGSAALKQYFQDNLAAGTSVPLRGGNRLLGMLSVGLGSLRISKWRIFPAIDIEEVDTLGGRVPAAIVAANPTAANWSSPGFSIALLPGLDWYRDRLNAGLPIPLITAGVRFPYYYAGEPFTALGALFSNNRSGYQHSGSALFELGIYFPLESVQKLPSQ
ncbi:MAG TPA: hypothetical protein VGI92_00020 [Gemmatimonadales bacterium]